MKTILKNIFLLSLLFININSCIGAEILKFELGSDYLISTEEKINVTAVKNPEIINIAPFFTIFNEKNVLLIHPEKIGRTSFIMYVDTGDTTFDVAVVPKGKGGEFKSVERNGFEITIIDRPPVFEELELDNPPHKIDKPTQTKE